jgi:hypothetical protein
MQQAMMERQEIQLPEELFNTSDQQLQDEPIAVKGAEKTKKQKVWGPVQHLRQSSRIDRSKNVMDKAKELKKKINLEIPASKKLSGIMKENPFNILHFYTLESMASDVGVKIDNLVRDSSVEDAEVVDSAVEVTDNSDTQYATDDRIGVEVEEFTSKVIESPDQYNTTHEIYDIDDDSWTKFHSRKRGKHPRKLFRC